MSVQEQIKEYIASQPEPKRSDMQELHRAIGKIIPSADALGYQRSAPNGAKKGCYPILAPLHF